MKATQPLALTTWSGMGLIGVGLILVLIQFFFRDAGTDPATRSFSASQTGFTLNTTYVGVLVIAIGAAMLVAAAFAARTPKPTGGK